MKKDQSSYQVALLSVIGFALVCIAWFYVEVAYKKVLPSAASTEIHVHNGDTISALSRRLEAEGRIRSGLLFKLAFLFQHSAKSLKSGDYVINAQDTMQDLVNRIARGEVLQEAFTIVEGVTWRALWDKLSKDSRFVHSNEEEVRLFFNKAGPYTDISTLEGLFLPNTYHFAAGVKDIEVLMHAYTEQQVFLQQIWQERDQKTPWKTPYEALVVASLIERESRIESEFNTISGVIQNRIKKGMPIQIDAAVIYGCQTSNPRPDTDTSHSFVTLRKKILKLCVLNGKATCYDSILYK